MNTQTETKNALANVTIVRRHANLEVTAHTGSRYPFVSVQCGGEEVAAFDLLPGLRRHTVNHAGSTLHIMANIGGSYEYVQLLDGADEEIAWYEASNGKWDFERALVS